MTTTRCMSCFENAKGTHYAGDCREYASQVAFTKRVQRLLANETPWHARPVPQATYEAPRYSLPAVMPEVKAFKVALKALGDWQRDVMGASQGGACAECLYAAHVAASAPMRSVYRSGRYVQEPDEHPERLAPIAHTCGKVAPVVASKGRRRAKVAA